tara:strand:+ start:233 stop:439 length:207 start_codon:yes stop_codon:yes gene_type:complete
MKKSKNYSKHDLRRSMEELYRNTQIIIQRLTTFETLFNEYIAMEDNEDKFREFLDKKYKVDTPETLKK